MDHAKGCTHLTEDPEIQQELLQVNPQISGPFIFLLIQESFALKLTMDALYCMHTRQQEEQVLLSWN